MTGINAIIGPISYPADCSVTGYLQGPYLNSPYLGPNLGYLSLDYLAGPYLLYDIRCGKLGIETLLVIDTEIPSGIEALATIDTDFVSGVETLATIDTEIPSGIENLAIIDTEIPSGIETLATIDTDFVSGIETLAIIDTQVPTGIEVLRLAAVETGVQSFVRLYNVDKLRVLCEFDSRGEIDQNWSVISGGTAAGDFNINNVNTDIFEEIYRSTEQIVILQCDTGLDAGSIIDTMWLGNHNLTTGALITVIASNDVTFVTPSYSFNFPAVTTSEVYYIVPDADYPPAAVRYYRIIINDSSNPNGFISIAHILFGSSVIFNGDCITNEVTRQILHFKDEIPTEGFTSVMLNRAVRKKVGFSFQNLNYRLGNYQKLVDVFLSSRTDLKCLWIPYPVDPGRFGIFGKLSEIPQEAHNVRGNTNEDLDFVSFDILIDESL